MRRIFILSLTVTLLALPAAASGLASAKCEPNAIDATAPEISALLQGYQLLALGSPLRLVQAEGASKVESLRFEVRSPEGSLIGTGNTSCKGTCSATGCTVSGCKVETGGCSHCSCSGIHCDGYCTCKKSTTFEMAPGPVNPGPVPIGPRTRN
ncbi:MAG: hypothetical protein AAF604_06930 [Acidobacteriota bacterium]